MARRFRPDTSRPPLPSEAWKIRVRDIMSSPVYTILETESALVASERMRERHLQHLVVIDERGRVTGVLSDRDLRAAQPSKLLIKDEAMRGKALGVIRVKDLMAADPHVARKNDPVEDILGDMLERRIGCIPVVSSDGDPVGIVTGGDVIQLTLRLIGAR
jgi:acetoin utilization protein AcuB